MNVRQRQPQQRASKWPWLVVLVAVVGLGLTAFFTRESWLPARVVSVTEATVPDAPAGQSPVLVAGGYLAAEQEVALAPTVSGRLAEVLVEEGDVVEAGHVLARLDDRDYRAALEIARAALARARASVTQAKASRVSADVAVREAESNAARKRTLLERGVATAADEEQAALGSDRARASRSSADASMSGASAEVLQAAASVRAAELNLEATELRAPFAGVVLDRTMDPGAIVGPFGMEISSVLTLGDVSRLHVDIDVSEADIARVRRGMGARVTPDAYRDRTFAATVVRVAPRADRTRGIVPVRVDVIDKDEALRPGLAAKVLFFEQAAEPAAGEGTARAGAPAGGTLSPRVPRSSVFREKGRTYVAVVEDGRVKRREVTLGIEMGDEVEISAGLEAGERVVATGASTLQEGERVSAGP